MSIAAHIHIPFAPGVMRTETLEALIEACVQVSADWFRSETQRCAAMRADGVAVPMPPCCLGCVEPPIRYERPAQGQYCQDWWLPPDVLRRGLASCLDAAIFDAAAARAKGRDARVALETQTYAGDPSRPVDFHAVAVIEGKRVDSTKKLALPAIEARCAC